ncbi:hypothetical protein [Pseudomonas sp. Kh13]|uniref:hypothetical protein n=1 Tax=Pseudomonas sp. Kh13 TaxID=2093744 RepID=UPI001182022A|nr:hypothetical protein [Pseudomonas sp. Kh13]
MATTECSTVGEKWMLILPHGRRFLGVNSVTNSEPGKGFVPVPIIRNEYWFEKFYMRRLVELSGFCRQKRVKRSKRLGKPLKYIGFPPIEHSGYAI